MNDLQSLLWLIAFNSSPNSAIWMKWIFVDVPNLKRSSQSSPNIKTILESRIPSYACGISVSTGSSLVSLTISHIPLNQSILKQIVICYRLCFRRNCLWVVNSSAKAQKRDRTPLFMSNPRPPTLRLRLALLIVWASKNDTSDVLDANSVLGDLKRSHNLLKGFILRPCRKVKQASLYVAVQNIWCTPFVKSHSYAFLEVTQSSKRSLPKTPSTVAVLHHLHATLHAYIIWSIIHPRVKIAYHSDAIPHKNVQLQSIRHGQTSWEERNWEHREPCEALSSGIQRCTTAN